MAATTLSGAIISIGPATVVDTLALIKALTPFVPIGEAEDYGEVGDDSPLVTFASVGDGRIRNLKGARNAGSLTLVCARDPLDAGQQALIAGEKTKFQFAIKIELPDKPTPAGTNSTLYFRALVASARNRLGTNDNVMRQVFTLAVNSQVFEEPATA
jgi:hypothetical protein